MRWARLLSALVVTAASTLAAHAQPGISRTPDVGYEPTPHAVAAAMLTLAHVGPGDVVYDLGSGDGRLVMLAAERFGARGVGIELDPALVAQARRTAATRGLTEKVEFIEGDLFTADLARATVITAFLSPSVNRRLEPKLRRELRPGARVVAHMFRMGSWTPDETSRTPEGADLFLYAVHRPPTRTPDIAFTPTPPLVVDAMLSLASVGPDDVVYDLGSGDGRVVVTAAQKYGARGIGVELDPALVEKSRLVAREGGVGDRVTFIEADLFRVDVSPATVVTLALSTALNARLWPALWRDLRPGARIVSRHPGPDGSPPPRVLPAPDGSSLYFWTIPPR